MPTPNDLIERLTTYFSGLGDPGVISAYLFGSQGSGRAHRESDIDLAVLLDRSRFPETRDRFDFRVRAGAELIHALGSNEVDLMVLNDVPPHFGRRIVWEGSRVFCQDPEADHAFVRDVQLRAADLEPFLRWTRRLKLAALAR